MIFPLLTSRRRQTTIRALYGAIVAQARRPSFYLDFGVQDTVNGRFDMIVLHMSLLLRRMEADPKLRRLGQEVFDCFCADLDDHFREQGVGDMRVPKEMQKLAEAFYGRHQAYRDALAEAGDGALVSALVRNIYAGKPASAVPAAPLAGYVREAAAALEWQNGLADGELSWPEPKSIFHVGKASDGSRA